MSFSPDELKRYQRHLSLAGFGPEAQEKLKRSAVLVIGAGGLGCPVLLYLAAAGVGRIVLVDPDTLDVSNLQRQILYTSEDAGRSKARAAAARLQALNPFITIEPHVERFTRSNALALVRSVDVVIDGTDNFPTRYLANDACVLADRPLVYGAIYGFEGQVSVFNWRGGPTYRCLFPDPPAPGTVPNCAEAGVLGVLPGLIGTVQATEAIKVLTGIGEPLSGKLLLWDALTMENRTVRFVADPTSRQITELPPDGYGETCAVDQDPDEIDADGVPAGVQLLDVREDWERQLGLIEPSAHVPLGHLVRGLRPAELDPQQPTIVYCAAGVRSLHALPVLRERYGFRDVRSLRGGYKAWIESGQPARR
jgi:sulfur-carrier protein adenylyltransferase/sulfurtransferase